MNNQVHLHCPLFAIIAGIDSRYNEGTQELINYLLFGFFALRKTEIEKSGFDEETIDGYIISIFLFPSLQWLAFATCNRNDLFL